MKKPLNNPYSKYRFDNNYSPKLRVDEGRVSMYGVEQRTLKNDIKAQISEVPPTWINNGVTWVVNNVYKCSQITKFDQPIINTPLASKWYTFFKLFKL